MLAKVTKEDLSKSQSEVAKPKFKFPKSGDQFLAFAGRNAHLCQLRGVGLSNLLEVKVHLKLRRASIEIIVCYRKCLVIDEPRNVCGPKGHAPIELREVISQLVL